MQSILQQTVSAHRILPEGFGEEEPWGWGPASWTPKISQNPVILADLNIDEELLDDTTSLQPGESDAPSTSGGAWTQPGGEEGGAAAGTWQAHMLEEGLAEAVADSANGGRGGKRRRVVKFKPPHPPELR